MPSTPGRRPTYAGLSSSRRQLTGAVQALGRGDGQIGRLAVRAGLIRLRVGEDVPAAPAHIDAVGHDDQEVHDGYEDDEVNERPDERAQIHPLPVERPADSLT